MCGRNFGNLLLPALAGLLAAETLTPIQTTAQQTGPRAVPQPACPKCKAAVSPAFDWCPRCGQALQAQSAKMEVCAYCGRTMTTGAQYCASCGGPAGKR